MKLIHWMLSLLATLLLAACGGGGVGPEGSQPFGGSSGSGTVSTSGATLSVTISSPTLTPTEPATLTLTLKNGQGQALAGRVLSLSTGADRGVLSATSVVTDASGVASAQLRVGTSSAPGAALVTATAALTGTTTVEGTVAYQVALGAAAISATLSAPTVSASQPVTVTAQLRDTQGRPAGGQIVQFTSSGSLLAFSAASAVTDANGSASVMATPANPGSSSTTQVSVTATVNNVTVTERLALAIAGEQPTVKLTLSSTTISSTAPAAVRATVLDARGQPVPGSLVTFASMQSLGNFSSTTAMTDAFGIATVTLLPRTAATVGADFITAQATLRSVTASDQVVAQFVPTSTGSTGQPTLSLSLSSNTVSSANPAVVTATLLDAAGKGVPNRVVGFTTLRGLGSLSLATALTDGNGQAMVSLAPASSTTSGADDVVANVILGGTNLQSTQGFQLQVARVTLSRFASSVGTATLSPYGQASLTVTVDGASAGSPVSVVIGSACLTAGKATVSPATFTATSAVTTVQYKDNGCGALQNVDKLQASIAGSAAAPLLLDIGLGSPSISSLSFVEASPTVIFLKGSGFGEVSTVSFELRDFAGNPLPNQDIVLSLVSNAGGVTIEGGPGPVTQRTNGAGRVSVRVNSGTVPTPIRVVASASQGAIQTVSSALSVGVGLPSQLNFSLSQTTANIEGFNLDGTPNAYTVIASDRNGNPVPAATSINFVTESGQIEAIRQTTVTQGLSRTSANFISASPRPADGRLTVTAYALGEESFLDQNGNNVYDAGEPFEDLGDIFKDRNFDGLFDRTSDETIALGLTGSSACLLPNNALLPRTAASVPGTCDGRWGRAYVRRSIETVLSTSAADLLWLAGNGPTANVSTVALTTGPNTGTTTFRQVAGSSLASAGAAGTLSFIVRDRNELRLNPVAAGSIITVSATEGLTVTLLGGSPVANTTEATIAALRYEFAATASSGLVTIRVTSPSGVGTAFTVPITK